MQNVMVWRVNLCHTIASEWISIHHCNSRGEQYPTTWCATHNPLHESLT